MRGESLVVTAADIQQVGSANIGLRLMEWFSSMAQTGHRDVLVRLELPGGTVGGFTLTPRRMSWLSRLLWKVGSRGMVVRA